MTPSMDRALDGRVPSLEEVISAEGSFGLRLSARKKRWNERMDALVCTIEDATVGFPVTSPPDEAARCYSM